LVHDQFQTVVSELGYTWKGHGMPVVIVQLCKVLCHSGFDAACTASKVQTSCNREKCSHIRYCNVQVPSGVIYFVALLSPILFLFLLRHSLFLLPAIFHPPVILTTSRNHENKPKNTANQKGGQGLVVLRVLPSPYGSGIFPVLG